MNKILKKTIKYRGVAFAGRLALFFLGIYILPNILVGGLGGIIMGEIFATILYYFFEKHECDKK